VPPRDVIAWDDGQASLWHGGGFRKSRKPGRSNRSGGRSLSG
jgi:hypothetical protein